MSSTEPASSAFHAVVLAGPHDVARGFLAGLRLGCGEAAPVYLEAELEAGASLGHRLKEKIAAHGHFRAVVPASLAARLEVLAGRLQEEAGLELVEVRPVRTARFAFRYRVYAREHCAEILALLAGLPAGLRREGGEPAESTDPRAQGTEVYTPAHAYEARGEGWIAGPPDRVVAARAQLAAHPMVEADGIELELG